MEKGPCTPLYNNRVTAYETIGDLARFNVEFAKSRRLEREMDKRSL
jgi:hypothetical protein